MLLQHNYVISVEPLPIAKTISNALISSRLDYCNSLLNNIAKQDLSKRQWVQTCHACVVGETGASCYRGRLLQGRFRQNYHIDGNIADSSCIRIHQGNHWRKKTIDARELFELWTKITFGTAETFFYASSQLFF